MVFDRIKEAFALVAKDEVEKMSIVQEIMLKSTEPVGGQGGVTMSYLCPHCNSFPLEFGGSLPEKPQSGGAQFVEKSMTGATE